MVWDEDREGVGGTGGREVTKKGNTETRVLRVEDPMSCTPTETSEPRTRHFTREVSRFKVELRQVE